MFHEPGLAHPQPGHACTTVALAAHGQSLLSTGRDCKLRHWNLAIASTKPHPHGGAKPGANTPSAEDVPAEQRARSGNLSSGLRWERTMPMSAWYGATVHSAAGEPAGWLTDTAVGLGWIGCQGKYCGMGAGRSTHCLWVHQQQCACVHPERRAAPPDPRAQHGRASGRAACLF